MRHLLIVGLLFLTPSAASTAVGADAQQLAPRNTEPITIHLVNSPFEDAIRFLGKQAGIQVEYDESASRERRNTKLTLRLEKVTLEEALDTMTRMAGLTYKVADPQTILIYQLP
jgi:type II secretory pathway component GspD/PulD (secretin)